MKLKEKSCHPKVVRIYFQDSPFPNLKFQIHRSRSEKLKFKDYPSDFCDVRLRNH